MQSGNDTWARGRAKDWCAAALLHVRELRPRFSLRGAALQPPQFEYQLLSLLARNELSARATLPLLAVLFSLVAMSWAPGLQASAWLATVICMKILMLAACLRFRAEPRAEMRLDTWRNIFIWLELGSGIAWGGMAVVGPGNADAAGDVFILAFLIALLAIRMTCTSPVMTILHVGSIPMTLAVCGRFLMQEHPLHWAMAAMAIGMHIYFMVLARGFNSTLRAVLEARAERDALIAEIEEVKSISEEARRRAEAANTAKSRFLATMSHELRTPLNAILGFSEAMKSELLGPMPCEGYKLYAGNIHDSGRHLLQLINELLDLSRIEAGRYELHEEALRLCDVAEHCLGLLQMRAESKGLCVALEFAAGLEQVRADQRAIRQICLNLISNALKFTPRGGRITVLIAATPDGGQMLIVRDTGPGIPKEEIPRIMQAFGQGSLAHRTAEGGTGLGLPIVQGLVSLHGGTFELRSEPRKGTEAVVCLPASRVLRAMPPPQPPERDCQRWPAAAPRQPVRGREVAGAPTAAGNPQ